MNNYESRQWQIHLVAECQDCDWETGDYLNGRAAAASHSRKTGHKVTGEAGYSFVYEGKKKPESSENNDDIPYRRG